MPMNSSILLAQRATVYFQKSLDEIEKKESRGARFTETRDRLPIVSQSCFVTDHASRQHLVSSSLFFRSGTPFDPVFSIVEKGAERETLGYQSGGGIWDAGKLIYLRGRPDIRFVELRFKSACRRSGR